jgi:excinuclease UvrABC ATPase subunit
MNRIAVFLDEEEVTDQVSSLKKDNIVPYLPGAVYEGLGLENATLKWNAVPETKNEANAKAPDHSTSIPVPSDVDEAEDLTETISSSEDRNFELLDVSVKFPEGQLTIVTGPTASGKTALLVRLSNIVFFIFAQTACSWPCWGK